MSAIVQNVKTPTQKNDEALLELKRLKAKLSKATETLKTTQSDVAKMNSCKPQLDTLQKITRELSFNVLCLKYQVHVLNYTEGP